MLVNTKQTKQPTHPKPCIICDSDVYWTKNNNNNKKSRVKSVVIKKNPLSALMHICFIDLLQSISIQLSAIEFLINKQEETESTLACSMNHTIAFSTWAE